MSKIDKKRRRLVIAGTSVVGAAGIAAAGYSFIRFMSPSQKAQIQGGPIKVDFSKLQPGQQLMVEWRSQPIWILKRNTEMLKELETPELRKILRDPDSKVESQQPKYAQSKYRSIKPDVFVVIALCTHLGCIPKYWPEPRSAQRGTNWPGGYFCPCHGSKFDLAGRVFKGVPAPTNLVVPPHYFMSKNIVKIGLDKA